MLTIRLAWRNLFRNARRTILTVLLISMSLAAMIMADGAILGMTAMMKDSVTETLMGDVQIQHPRFQESFEADLVIDGGSALLSQVREDSSVIAAAPRVVAGGMVSSPYNLSGAQVLGVDAASEIDVSKIRAALIDGEYLTGKNGEILIGNELADLLEVELGDRLVVTLAEAESGELAQALFRVSGIVQFGLREMDESIALVNLPQLQTVMAMDDQYHQIIVQLVDRAQSENPALSLKALETAEVDVLGWMEANPDIGSILGITEYSTVILGTIIFLLASLGIINSMFMSIFERLYEIGVMKAVGTKPWQLIMLVIYEAGLIALMSCVVGVIVGGLGSYYCSIHGIPIGQMEVVGVNFSILKTELQLHQFTNFPLYIIALTIVASLYPARFASKIIPALALKKTL